MKGQASSWGQSPRRPAHSRRAGSTSRRCCGECSPNMRVAQEEIFGTVVSVIPINSLEQAIDVANGWLTDFPPPSTHAT